MKVVEMIVPYGSKDEAKLIGCRWDASKSCWYVPLAKYNDYPESFEPFKVLALADTNNVQKETLKELGCKWNMTYKKWTINKLSYKTNMSKFDEHNLKVLLEIKKVYIFIPLPVKSEEDQLAELIAIMATDDDE